MPEVKQQRGQFFTANQTVQAVLGSLITSRTGRLLEPSAGAGHLVRWAETNLPHMQIDAVELDTTVTSICATPITHANFFSYAHGKHNTYDVILGNPPYVAWKAVEPTTQDLAAPIKAPYSDKANLYYLFIDRCVDLLVPGAELIFIVPKEWLYTSSANPLRQKLLHTGHLTHLIDCGEEKLFEDANVPALLIFRFVKGAPGNHVQFAASLNAAHNKTYVPRTLTNNHGRLLLLDPKLAASIQGWGVLADTYHVRVGMISGADHIFRIPEGVTLEASCVKDYLTTKGTEKFLDVNHIRRWVDMPPLTAAYLTQHKATLINRKITRFTEKNWWKYGAIRNREHMVKPGARFYGYAKTRSETPFFTHPTATLFSGGILGLFQANGTDLSPATAMAVLNHPAYRGVLEAMFLTTGNKVSLQPGTLEDAPFPTSEAQAHNWLTQQAS